MFTGIIKAQGIVERVEPRGGDVRLTFGSGELDLAGFADGESIAVSGVCLTALDIAPGRFSADVSRETLKLTTLGRLSAGDRVNLEPALAAGERLGGHIVTGHIDGMAKITERFDDGRSIVFGFEVPPALARYVARKGSIALDGISLTVNDVDANRFRINVIPHTAEVTTLADRGVGDNVNVEVDLMARYLERLTAVPATQPALERES
ncbi:MAG: riboflavin synthase [Pseudomonadota bacterium]